MTSLDRNANRGVTGSAINDGVLRASTVVKLIPDQSVLKLQIGDPIRLTEEQFERLSAAFFAELERKFL